jgi:hypothetical protein
VIWLYSFSYYGLQKLQFATIENGRAQVSFDSGRLKSELDPHPNTDGYVVALQIRSYEDDRHDLWYRTPNISPDELWTNFRAAVNSLGKATASPPGTKLVLDSPHRRHITLLYFDGRPAANADLTVSEYLWDNNHCAGPSGLDFGTFRTNAQGTIQVLAPLVPLYLDGVSYYEKAGVGPAGVAYSNNIGLKLVAEQDMIVKEGWQLTDDDSLLEEFKLQVLTAAGRPRPNIDVYGTWNTNTCGGADRIGRTDFKGRARIGLDTSFIHLELMIGGPYSAGDRQAEGKSRDLTNDELRELFSKQKLIIKW